MDPSSLRSVMLIPSALAVPVYLSQEELSMGVTVFHNFVHEEFIQEGLTDEEIIEDALEAPAGDFIDENLAIAHNAMLTGPNQSISILHVGERIRELANDFALSKERETIRSISDQVDLSSINYNTFWNVLEDVFRQGVSSYNLIALFYFCSDVLIRCVKSGLKQLGHNLFRWAVKYVVEQVCTWVHNHGGWEKAAKSALQNKTFQYLACSVIAVSFCLLALRVYRKM